MKLVTFVGQDGARLGVLVGVDRVLDLSGVDAALPGSMIALIAAGAPVLDRVRALAAAPPAAHLLPAASVRLAAPIPRPVKNVFCVGRNYREHVIEGARARGVEVAMPRTPEFFTKPPTAVIGPDAGIERHAAQTGQLDYEIELGLVIGRKIRDATASNALDSIFGYTVINDVTARDRQRAQSQWFKGKALDTSCPMGPCIVTADEFGRPEGHRLTLKVNGEIRQNATTADMLFSVPDIIAHLSAGMTLEPGDVIATGTPSGVAMGMDPPKWLEVGDVIEAEIEGIGLLRNKVAGGA
jgi:2-keto-4-pentenoate hydratase/2-oxohepta-3-ene-1,7-dioic acid hydratase in catechol pathway